MYVLQNFLMNFAPFLCKCYIEFMKLLCILYAEGTHVSFTQVI